MITRLGWIVVLLGCGDATHTAGGETRDVGDEAAPLEEVAMPDGGPDSGPEPDLGSDGVDDSAPLEDVPGASTGSACDDDDECSSGWCVASAIGRVCVDLCVTMCDVGEACIAVDSGTDPVSVCVPTIVPDGEVTDSRETVDALDDVATGDAIATGDATATDDGMATDSVATDDTTIGDATPSETDTATDTTLGTDQDGDGIPDDEDNLPCLALTLVVFNEDVTSASLELNGAEIVNANAFPTDDAIYVTINPTAGENTLALGGQLTGSPSDTLTLFITDSSGVVYFATVITRDPGKPADRTYTFTIDVTCP